MGSQVLRRYIPALVTPVLLVGCGRLDGIGGGSWDYEKLVDPITKSVSHRASGYVAPLGSSTAQTSLFFSFDCKREDDPRSLTVEITAFDGDSKGADSGLDFSGELNIRFNDTVIGPIAREGTEFSNSSKWLLADLNLLPLFESFKNAEEFRVARAFSGVGQAFGLPSATENPVAKIQMMAAALAGARVDKKSTLLSRVEPYQFRIWSDEFVFSAVTSAGDINATVSLSDDAIKRTIEACGFSFGPAPTPEAGIDVEDAVRSEIESNGLNGSRDESDRAVAPDEAAVLDQSAPSEEVGIGDQSGDSDSAAAPDEAAKPYESIG